LEEVKATQTISQRLSEAAEGTHTTGFEDIVPKPYQEFKDIFAKESFDKTPRSEEMDHTIELVPDAQTFSTKVYLWFQSNRSARQFLQETSELMLFDWNQRVDLGAECLSIWDKFDGVVPFLPIWEFVEGLFSKDVFELLVRLGNYILEACCVGPFCCF